MSPEQIHELEVLRREEAILAAQLAAGISGQMKQIESMTLPGSNVSKTRPIDPRQFLKGVPGVAAHMRPQPPQQGQVRVPQGQMDPSLEPRVRTIPMPNGVPVDEIIPPEMRRPPVVIPQIAPEVIPQIQTPAKNGQLELDFDRQVVLNDIFSHLEALNSKLDKILLTLSKPSNGYNANISESDSRFTRASEIDSTDKKKSAANT